LEKEKQSKFRIFYYYALFLSWFWNWFCDLGIYAELADEKASSDRGFFYFHCSITKLFCHRLKEDGTT